MSDAAIEPLTPTPLQIAVQSVIDAQAQIARLQPPMIEGVAVAPYVKPGFQTSEFWLTAVHSISSLVAASGAVPGFQDPTIRATSLGSALVSIGFYIWSRVKTKTK